MIHNLLIMFFPLFHPTVFTGGHTIVLIAELGERAGPRLRELGSTTRGRESGGGIHRFMQHRAHFFDQLCTFILLSMYFNFILLL